MISSTTLLLGTLVFNAASVLGAPIRLDTVSEHVARADLSTGQPIARALVVKRDDSFAEFMIVREPVAASPSVVESRDESRRYPRRALHDFYVKREPATTIKETLVITKTTKHDTPEDAAAHPSPANTPVDAAAAAAASAAAGVTTQVDSAAKPAIDAAASSAAQATTTTIASESSATTLPCPDAPAATPAAPSPIVETPAAPTTTAVATDSPAATPKATDATPASPTATDAAAPKYPAAAVAADATTPTGTDPAAAPSVTSTPPVADGTPSPTTASTVEGRWVKASSSPVARRSLAVSGASWASALRRSVPQDYGNKVTVVKM